MRKTVASVLPLLFAVSAACAADDDKWVTIKGRVIWDSSRGDPPKRKPLIATKDADVAAKDDDFNSEEWIVDAKTLGLKNAVVSLMPEPTEPKEIAALKAAIAAGKKPKFRSFTAAEIHPSLAKPAAKSIELDQPCCRFIPHVQAARAGQEFVIKNSASCAHNAKYVSSPEGNGEENPLIPAGKSYTFPKPLAAEPVSQITIECNIHSWIKAYVRVYDHPYFAVTDKDGAFEIKLAPVLKGKLRMFIWHEEGLHKGNDGRYGDVIEVKPGTLDLKEIKFAGGPKKEEKK